MTNFKVFSCKLNHITVFQHHAILCYKRIDLPWIRPHDLCKSWRRMRSGIANVTQTSATPLHVKVLVTFCWRLKNSIIIPLWYCWNRVQRFLLWRPHRKSSVSRTVPRCDPGVLEDFRCPKLSNLFSPAIPFIS